MQDFAFFFCASSKHALSMSSVNLPRWQKCSVSRCLLISFLNAYQHYKAWACPPFTCNHFGRLLDLAARTSYREIAMTAVAARGLANIPLQKSQGFSLRRLQKTFRCRNRRVFRFAGRKTKIASLAIFGLPSKSKETRSDHLGTPRPVFTPMCV